MTPFYEILDLIYEFNKKWSEIRFGQLIHNLMAKDESLFYTSDEKLVERLRIIFKEMDENE
jgi:hypothetical protein